jgi:cell fate (sporulation/competence/biofilm development) regulator YlbF (YheA/YmcA/DUF963 family)
MINNIYDIINDLDNILFDVDEFKEFYNDSDLIESLECDILDYYNLY